MKKIILIGAGAHAHACIDVIEKCKKYSIAGLIAKKKLTSKIFDYPVLGTDKELKKISKKIYYSYHNGIRFFIHKLNLIK